jgi:hypothetical protein
MFEQSLVEQVAAIFEKRREELGPGLCETDRHGGGRRGG